MTLEARKDNKISLPGREVRNSSTGSDDSSSSKSGEYSKGINETQRMTQGRIDLLQIDQAGVSSKEPTRHESRDQGLILQRAIDSQWKESTSEVLFWRVHEEEALYHQPGLSVRLLSTSL